MKTKLLAKIRKDVMLDYYPQTKIYVVSVKVCDFDGEFTKTFHEEKVALRYYYEAMREYINENYSYLRRKKRIR
jgi:hypothetical protein